MLEYYLKHGLGLTPIAPNSKRPILDKWTEKPFFEIPEKYKNHNWGWVVGGGYLVIDVDPRNGGAESLKRISSLFQQRENRKMIESFPVVRTPGGGVHMYATCPKDFKPRRDREFKTKILPGLDFIVQGGYVMVSGSYFKGDDYEGEYFFDSRSPFHGPPQPTPKWLLEMVAAVIRDSPRGPSGEFTRSQIESMLSQLDVTEYADNDSWLQLLQATHEASGGEALDLFLDWSLADPTYADQRETIINRWNSHKPGKAGNITAGTLVKAVLDAKGVIPPPTSAEEVDSLPELPPDLPRTVGEITADGRESQRCPVAHLDKMIAEVKAGTGIDKLKTILGEIGKHQKADRERLLRSLSKRTGHRVVDLRDVLAVTIANRIDIPDAGVEVATLTLNEQFESTDHVLHAADQQYWMYRETHWEPLARNLVNGKLYKSACEWSARNPESRASVAGLIQAGDRILSAMLASEVDMYAVSRGLNTIINVLNGELHIDGKAGTYDLRSHDPAHWQTTILPVEYDPLAECPRFDRYLIEVFNGNQEIIRHVWELLGYTIQRCKNIATWVLLTGEGANGKTTLLNVLSRLLGKTVLNSPINEVESDKHGMERMINKLALIDEDLKKGYALPDGFLKKFSENKEMSARPLYASNIDFQNTAIVWMAANELPRAQDISHGMVRRAQVIHFGRIFSEEEQDPNLSAYIIGHELPGVLVQALDGLRRLRTRGRFLPPREAEDIKRKWKVTASPMALWISTAIERSMGKHVLFREAYMHFRLWAQDQGMDRAMSKPGFRKALESVGYVVKNGGGNKLQIKDVSLKDIEMDGD